MKVCAQLSMKKLTLGPRLKKSAFSSSARLLPAKSSINFVHHKTELLRGGPRISEKGVHVYKGVWGWGRFADFISFFLNIS